MSTFGQGTQEQVPGQNSVHVNPSAGDAEHESPETPVSGQPGAGVSADIAANESADEVDEVDESQDDADEEGDLDDVSESAEYAPRRGDFNWADIQGAVQFALSLRELPYGRRYRIKSLMGFDGEADIIFMLDRMTPPSGQQSALEFVSDLVDKLSSGNLSFQDGINFATQFQQYEVEQIRRIAQLLDLLNEYYVAEGHEGINVRYRKNMDIAATIDLFSSAIDPLDTEQVKQDLDLAVELYQTWTLA